eukprot:13641.XXX_423411_423527_1 [CDS] Oithona nana genome sequencing.
MLLSIWTVQLFSREDRSQPKLLLTIKLSKKAMLKDAMM